MKGRNEFSSWGVGEDRVCCGGIWFRSSVEVAHKKKWCGLFDGGEVCGEILEGGLSAFVWWDVTVAENDGVLLSRYGNGGEKRMGLENDSIKAESKENGGGRG